MDGPAPLLTKLVGRGPDFGELYEMLAKAGRNVELSTALLRDLMRAWPDGIEKRVELVELEVGARSRPFDESERTDEPARHPETADRKVLHRALGLSTPERVRRYAQLAHAVALHPEFARGHRSMAPGSDRDAVTRRRGADR